MNDTETRLRSALHDLADEVAPAPLLERLQRNHRSAVHRRRLTLAVVAAATVAAVAAGSLVIQRMDQSRFIEPVKRPPKVFRLSGATASAPGQAQVAVLTAQSAVGIATAHLASGDAQRAVSLPPSDWVPSVFTQQLSADGTQLVRGYDRVFDLRMEVVDLTTGSTRRLRDYRGWCPRLAPDNRTLAFFDKETEGLLFIDVVTGRTLPGSGRVINLDPPCAGVGFSPDGRRLAVGGPEATLLLDLRGRTLARIPGRFPVNGPMSWSPDGRSLQMYDSAAGRFVVADVDDGGETVPAQPADAVRPVGWAGSRIVWLTGSPGRYRLVSTDGLGNDPRPWMRLDIGDRPVESVMWSRDLSGAPSDG